MNPRKLEKGRLYTIVFPKGWEFKIVKFLTASDWRYDYREFPYIRGGAPFLLLLDYDYSGPTDRHKFLVGDETLYSTYSRDFFKPVDFKKLASEIVWEEEDA